MKRLGGYALSILLLASLILNGYFVLSKQKDSTVVRVHDGDTFTLGDGQRVRLLGADAPELVLDSAEDSAGKRCGSEEARTLLESLVLGKTVHIAEEKRDAYGRRMGLVYVGTTLVNEQMLKSGYARPDYTANSKSEALKAAYKDATEAKRGIHSALCKSISPTPPNAKCTIKSNIDLATGSRLYHLKSCRHYSQIVLDADRGEKFYCTEEDARADGFTLAPDCLR